MHCALCIFPQQLAAPYVTVPTMENNLLQYSNGAIAWVTGPESQKPWHFTTGCSDRNPFRLHVLAEAKGVQNGNTLPQQQKNHTYNQTQQYRA